MLENYSNFQPAGHCSLRFSLVIAFLLLPLVSHADEPIRIWVDVDGQHSINASLVQVDENVVWLQRTDGQQVRVEIDQLSARDKKYIDRYLVEGTVGNNPLRGRPPQTAAAAPLPRLTLTPAVEHAEEGTTLPLSADSPLPESPSQTPLVADAAIDSFSFPPVRLKFGKVDLYDQCSHPIALANQPNDDEQNSAFAISISKGVITPGDPAPNRLLVFDVAEKTARLVWKGKQSIALFDVDQPSGRGLALIGHDRIGKGGHFCVVDQWNHDSIRMRNFRLLPKGSNVGDTRTVHWARWLDSEHFIALIDNTLGVWNILSGKQLYGIDSFDPRTRPALSGGRRTIAVQRTRSIELRNSADGKLLQRIPVAQSQSVGLGFSPDGDRLAITHQRRLEIWDGEALAFESKIESLESLGKRSPIWIDDDLILSSSGVLLSLFRGLPVWRYDMAGVRLSPLGDRFAMFRKEPVSEISLLRFPHRGARNAMEWIDQNSSAISSNWRVLGRSDWIGGYWSDRNVRLSAEPSDRR